MPAVAYTPGERYLIVADRCACLTTDPALAARLWPVINGGAGVTEALEVALAGGLSGLPDLLLCEPDGVETRVIVRGALTVTLNDAGGSERLDAGLVRTWVEHTGADVESVRTCDVDLDSLLPLARGVVRAAGFQWDRSLPDGGCWDGPAGRQVADPPHADPLPGPQAEPWVEPPAEDPAESEADPVEARQVPVPTAVAPAHRPLPPPPPPPPPADPVIRSKPATEPEPLQHVSVAEDTRMPPAEWDHTAASSTESEDIESEAPFRHLWDPTVLRGVDQAARRESAEPETEVEPAAGDHDGHTILGSGLAAIMNQVRSSPAPAPPQSVLLLRLSTGAQVRADRTVIIGRRPQPARVAGLDLPALVTVPSPQQDISRSHLQLTPVDGRTLVAADLNSTNGSTVRHADGAVEQLMAGAISTVGIGDVLDLGDGVSVTIGEVDGHEG